MATRTLTLELPDELLALLGSPETVAAKVQQALVLDLLRRAEISQGKAAELLGITRWDILDLMALHEIPSGPETAEELQQEVDTVRRLIADRRARAGRQ
jgi:predicted HTH domain antitoxin